jgi:hypothetical protein
MVFRGRPVRQSPFLSGESASVARAEFQQNAVDLIPRLASVAKCTNCRIVGDTVYFGENGVFELDVTPLLPSMRSILSLAIDRSRAPVGLSVDYEIAVKSTGTPLFQGRLVVLDQSDSAWSRALRLVAPVTGDMVLRLSASNVVLPLMFLRISTVSNTNFAFILPYPHRVSGSIISMWLLSIQPARYAVSIFWNSLDGNTATLTYREDGVDVATFSTTSTSTVVNSVSRVWRRDVLASYSASSNAVVKVFYIDFYVSPPALPVRALQASYSTSSASYVQYTPLNLSTVHARIRRIVVTASSNARWYVNIQGNRVLDSAWGITSIDLNPPVEATRVDLFLASADGANATASIIIIYDEVLGRL